ncbi:hypothetical protein E4U32_006306 [Claviceps aff. humidiphila group G2b]|nr:hypothetical protein E4U32_006306 [Claviceps aff. humidiphila group G2b]
MFDMSNAETASIPNYPPAKELKLVLRQRGQCEKVPSFQSGAHDRLTGMLQSLQYLFDEIEEESREGFRDLDQRLDGDALGLKVTVPNSNFMARMNNSTVVHEDARLAPFYSVLTGELIPNCPSTLRELNAVPAGDIKAILVELGEVVVTDREGRAVCDPKLDSSRGTNHLGAKANPEEEEERRRRPSSWDPLARYYSEAHSFPDYGSATDKMSLSRLREINGATAGGLNTLTHPPPPLVPRYHSSENPQSRRRNVNVATQDTTRSRFFPIPERQRAKETHDLARSDSQEELYDIRSVSSLGKPKAARVGVEEFRHAQPKSSTVRRSRARKSRLSSVHRNTPDAVGTDSNDPLSASGRSHTLESIEAPDTLLAEHGPQTSKASSHLVRAGLNRSGSELQTKISSPHFKRPRAHHLAESIESEDEVDHVQYRKKRRMTDFSDRFGEKYTSSRGDIQPSQFSQPRPKPSQSTVSAGLYVHVKRAVSGKSILDGVKDEGRLFLEKAQGGLLHPSSKLTRDGQTPLDWLAFDLDKVTKIEHAATQTHFVHVTRPRSHKSESNLWLELKDHCDVLRLVKATNQDRLVEIPHHELETKWEQAWNQAKKYRHSTMSLVQPSAPLPSGTQQKEPETVVHSRQSDRDDVGAPSRRAVKLVDQMRGSMRNEQGLSRRYSEEKIPAVANETVKEPELRRSRRSAPTQVPREESPERWSDNNPTWIAQWHQSLVFPATGKNRATVDVGDIPRLDEGQFLNDNLISFYIRYMQYNLERNSPELLRRVYFFNTFFFEKLRSTKGKINYDGVKAWTAKVDVLSYDYIVVPVNEHAHWYLAIICNAPNAVNGTPQESKDEDKTEHVEGSSPRVAAIERHMCDVTIRDGETKQSSADMRNPSSPTSSSKTMQSTSPVSKTAAPPDTQTNAAAQRHHDLRAPRIITLDSLASSHPSTIRALRDYLIAEAKEKKGVDLVTPPNGMTAKKIPQQDNFCDCGVYIMGYMASFMKDPDETIRKLLQREPLGWDIRPSRIRNELRDLLFTMQRDQHERLIKEKELKRSLSAKKKKGSVANDAKALPTIRAAKKETLPGERPPDAKLSDTGTSDRLPITQTRPPIEAAVDGDARKSRAETVAEPPSQRSMENSAASPKPSRIEADSHNKKNSGGRNDTHMHDVGASSTKHDTSVDGVTKPEMRTSITIVSTTSIQSPIKPDLVRTLPASSSETEGRVSQTVLKRTLTKSSTTDIEEVMSIVGSRPTNRRSPQLESSQSLIQPLAPSSSSLSAKSQAEYCGIERGLDLT